MVGSLFSSDAWNNVTFAAAEVKNPQRNLPLALVLGTGLVSLLYILANVVVSQRAAVRRRRRGRDGRGARHPSRHAGSCGHGRGRDDLRAERRAADGGRDPHLDVRLQQRIDSRRARECYYAMARDGLFFRRAGTLNKQQRPRLRVGRAVRSGRRSSASPGTYGQLLNYVIFAALLFYAFTTAGCSSCARSGRTPRARIAPSGIPCCPRCTSCSAAR